ncbi:hypothetical protein I7I50_10153 [Histoplasma capsulatum G186AR]|uniref:Uncharacterized protein n=1 Tax=Ajellomyces capsulatus TaxID=5037 RepID=A0A8H7Z920_AJECA|nr:hypothetical protein I7I52_01391 [Histoplasma capsulatum]QSS69001.1 hypothetical protein I7I50_10153 [Histoplasma capsulatum G186AR]
MLPSLSWNSRPLRYSHPCVTMSSRSYSRAGRCFWKNGCRYGPRTIHGILLDSTGEMKIGSPDRRAWI